MIDYGSANTADHPLLARRFVASGCLQKKRPRPPKSAPGGLKNEPQGGQNGVPELLGGSWAPDGCQDCSGGAVLAALGPLLAPLWAVLALPGGPREAPGGSGEGLREAMLVLLWMIQRQKLKKRPRTCYFNDCGKLLGQGFWL